MPIATPTRQFRASTDCTRKFSILQDRVDLDQSRASENVLSDPMANEDCHGQATILYGFGLGIHHGLDSCIAMGARAFDPGPRTPGHCTAELCCCWRYHDAGFHTQTFSGAMARNSWNMACCFALDPNFY